VLVIDSSSTMGRLSKKESEVKVWLMSSNVGHRKDLTGTGLKLLDLKHLPDYRCQASVNILNICIDSVVPNSL
jgi:hypothetical protein